MTAQTQQFIEARPFMERLLLGAYFMSFEFGDISSLRFFNGTFRKDLYLSFHECTSPSVPKIEETLRNRHEALFCGPDPGDVAQSAFLASLLRQRIVSTLFDQASMLRLTFENSATLIIRSDVDIVDWQWFIGATLGDPYSEPFALACFATDGIQINADACMNILREH